MKNIIVVGTGYVGLVTGTCLADLGHEVTCVDVDEKKIASLQSGIMPFFEPGLSDVVKRNVDARRLTFSTSLAEVLPGSHVVFIAVGTPAQPDGTADLRFVFQVAETIGANIAEYKVIVNKSTVPVGTGRKVEALIANHYKGDFDVVSCPEFLREGSALEDFQHPNRIIIGARKESAADILKEVFAKIAAPKVVTTVESAELIKYASNAYLATKISFINEIAQICERVGADIQEVAHGVGMDTRIGPQFLHAGIGWGGSCFPKDVQALDQIAGIHGYDFKLLKSVIEVNNHQRAHFVAKMRAHFGGSVHGKIFGILGLAFKANTDDVRESAGLDIIRMLVDEGATIQAFDYEAIENAKSVLPTHGVTYLQKPEEVALGVDAIAITTEWKEFRDLPWDAMKKEMRDPVVFDGRNLLDPETMRTTHGFTYYAIGRNHEKIAP